MDRNIQPIYNPLTEVKIPEIQEYTLRNGVKVYAVKATGAEVIRVDVSFGAGNWYQPNPLIAAMTNALMREGAGKQSAHEIAESIDYYGSHLQVHCDKDNAGFIAYTLSKYFENTLSILNDIVREPRFDSNELDVLVMKSRQNYRIENQKVSVISRRILMESMFGADNPYGEPLAEEQYDSVSMDEIKTYFNNYYSNKNCSILISGFVTDEHIKLIDKYFGDDFGNYINSEPDYILKPSDTKFNYSEKAGAVQSSVRLGKPSINLTSADYPKLQVVNTLLGGYFGSRLMKNIREDKGYTYGIGSVMVSLKQSGFFTIISEVGADVCKSAIEEINKEIDILCNTLVDEKELTLVKSYMMGDLARNLDGAFNIAETVKSVIDFGIGADFFRYQQECIMNISAQEIRDLAQKYLSKDSMYTAVAGRY